MIDACPSHQDDSAPEAVDLSHRLLKLSQAAAVLSIHVASKELKYRCSVLASGAQVAAGLLLRMPQMITTNSEVHKEAVTLPNSTSEGVETRLLYQLGWAAMELGLTTEALAVLEMVGTLLHGKPGGTVFKVESLLAIGKVDEAAATYKFEVDVDTDTTDLANAIFVTLWSQRGDVLWCNMKMRADKIIDHTP